MSASFDRAAEIITALTRKGVRATMDPSGANPPVVLVVPPDRTYDLACGFTARWHLAAVVPAALGADRSTWAALDDLVGAVAEVVDVERAELVSYQLNGASYPSFLITFEEAIS